ncbi:hypothetical protein HKD37_20G057530 [Glycine soja]
MSGSRLVKVLEKSISFLNVGMQATEVDTRHKIITQCERKSDLGTTTAAAATGNISSRRFLKSVTHVSIGVLTHRSFDEPNSSYPRGCCSCFSLTMAFDGKADTPIFSNLPLSIEKLDGSNYSTWASSINLWIHYFY